jgi:hypothetical protein
MPEFSLEHDPEKWNPVSEKIMLKQTDRASSRFRRDGTGSGSYPPEAEKNPLEENAAALGPRHRDRILSVQV